MAKFPSFGSAHPPFPALTPRKLRLRFMAQLRRIPEDPQAAARQRWRRWHTLHRHRWWRKPSVYLKVAVLRTLVRTPGGHYQAFPKALTRRKGAAAWFRQVQRVARTALELRWFWRRGYGLRVLRRLQALRRARRRPRWRRDRQKKRSLDRRKRWAQRRKRPPAGLPTTAPARRRRCFSPLASLRRTQPPRRRRESRRLPWRLAPAYEPRLRRRLPRGRFTTVLRNPQRRGHYPWLRVFAPDQGRLGTVGREEFEPCWRSSAETGPRRGRRGRLFAQNRRLVNLPRPAWTPKYNRSWHRFTGRYVQENRPWLRLLQVGIHALRQIQKKRYLPQGQLEGLPRRRFEAQGPRNKLFRNFFRRTPEPRSRARGYAGPPARGCRPRRFRAGTFPPTREPFQNCPLWSPRYPGFSPRRRRWNFSLASPEQPRPEILNPPGDPRFSAGFPDLSDEALRRVSAQDRAYQETRPVSEGPKLRRTLPQQNPGYGAPPSYGFFPRLVQKISFRHSRRTARRSNFHPGYGPKVWRVAPRLFLPPPPPPLLPRSNSAKRRLWAEATLRKALGQGLFEARGRRWHRPSLREQQRFFDPEPAHRYRTLAEHRGEQRRRYTLLVSLEQGFRQHLQAVEESQWSGWLGQVHPVWPNPCQLLDYFWKPVRSDRLPFGAKHWQRSFSPRKIFSGGNPLASPEAYGQRSGVLRLLVTLYHTNQLQRRLWLEEQLAAHPRDYGSAWANRQRRWNRPWTLPAQAYATPMKGLLLVRKLREETRQEQLRDLQYTFGANGSSLAQPPEVAEPRRQLHRRLRRPSAALGATEQDPVPLALQMLAYRHQWLWRRRPRALRLPSAGQAGGWSVHRTFPEGFRTPGFFEGLSGPQQRQFLALGAARSETQRAERHCQGLEKALVLEQRWWTEELRQDPATLGEPFPRKPARFSQRSPSFGRRRPFTAGQICQGLQKASEKGPVLGYRRNYRRCWETHQRRWVSGVRVLHSFRETLPKNPPGQKELFRTLQQAVRERRRKHVQAQTFGSPVRRRSRWRRLTHWLTRRERFGRFLKPFWTFLRRKSFQTLRSLSPVKPFPKKTRRPRTRPRGKNFSPFRLKRSRKLRPGGFSLPLAAVRIGRWVPGQQPTAAGVSAYLRWLCAVRRRWHQHQKDSEASPPTVHGYSTGFLHPSPLQLYPQTFNPDRFLRTSRAPAEESASAWISAALWAQCSRQKPWLPTPPFRRFGGSPGEFMGRLARTFHQKLAQFFRTQAKICRRRVFYAQFSRLPPKLRQTSPPEPWTIRWFLNRNAQIRLLALCRNFPKVSPTRSLWRSGPKLSKGFPCRKTWFKPGKKLLFGRTLKLPFFNHYFWHPLRRQRFTEAETALLRHPRLFALHQDYFPKLAQKCAFYALYHRRQSYAHRRPLFRGAPGQPPLCREAPRPRPYQLRNSPRRLWRASSLGAFDPCRYRNSFKSRWCGWAVHAEVFRFFHQSWVHRFAQRRALELLQRADAPQASVAALGEAFRWARELERFPEKFAQLSWPSTLLFRARNLPVFGSEFRPTPPEGVRAAPHYLPALAFAPPRGIPPPQNALDRALALWGKSRTFPEVLAPGTAGPLNQHTWLRVPGLILLRNHLKLVGFAVPLEEDLPRPEGWRPWLLSEALRESFPTTLPCLGLPGPAFPAKLPPVAPWRFPPAFPPFSPPSCSNLSGGLPGPVPEEFPEPKDFFNFPRPVWLSSGAPFPAVEGSKPRGSTFPGFEDFQNFCSPEPCPSRPGSGPFRNPFPKGRHYGGSLEHYFSGNRTPAPRGTETFFGGAAAEAGRRRRRWLFRPNFWSLPSLRRTRRCAKPPVASGRRYQNRLWTPLDPLGPECRELLPPGPYTHWAVFFPRGFKYPWVRLPRLPRRALPLTLYQARRKALWRRGLPRSRRVALQQLAHIYPRTTLRRLDRLRRPRGLTRCAFRRQRRRIGLRTIKWPRGRPSLRRNEHKKWLPAEGRSRWPPEWSLYHRRALVSHRRSTGRQRRGWSRRLAHWRRRRQRDRRFTAGGRMVRRRGKGGGYRLWGSRYRCKRARGRYYRHTHDLKHGKLRLRELRNRWRYPAAVRPLQPRYRRSHGRPRCPPVPTGNARRRRPVAMACTPKGFRSFRRRAFPRFWGRNPLHGLRIPQTFYFYWWRADSHSSWSRRQRALGRKRRRRPRTPKVQMALKERRLDWRSFRHKWLHRRMWTVALAENRNTPGKPAFPVFGTLEEPRPGKAPPLRALALFGHLRSGGAFQTQTNP